MGLHLIYKGSLVSIVLVLAGREGSRVKK